MKKTIEDYKAVLDPEKFWSIVQPKNTTECWEWTRGKNTGGYGLYSVRSPEWLYKKTGRTYTQLLAHRVAYYLHHGTISRDNLNNHVCHHCDNPKCCNPHHMFLGSMYDNVQDMIKKDRGFWKKHG